MGTVVVVGSNRGIGLEVTRVYAERGADVVGVCRSASDELRGLGVRIIEDVDISSDSAVQTLRDKLGDESVDVLLVVAGVLKQVGLDSLDFEVIDQLMEVNAYGPLRVVAALRDVLADGARIGLLTSRMGSIDDNTSGSHYAYRMSKAALNMAGKSLAMDLRDQGVAVRLLHPGYVRTDMTGGNGHIEPEEAAAGLVARMDDLDLESTGEFWHQNGEQLPW